MSRADELLEYLRRKGCAMQLNRIQLDFRWQAREIEALLDSLRKQHLVTVPRPGEFEAVPTPVAAPERAFIPPAEPASSPPIAQSIDVEKILGPKAAPRAAEPPNTQATPMARGKKRCEKCEASKGYRAFAAGSDTCNDCKGSKKAAAKPQGGVGQRAVNGAGKSFKDLVNRHANGARFAGTVEELRALAAKATAAADALEALG